MMLDTSSLNERIERLLKEEIVTGAFAPGQKLDIEQLATRWGVSITPVRDAVQRLEIAGLVHVAPRRGVYVSTPTEQTFRDVFDLRIALECLAVSSAITRIPAAEIDAVVAKSAEALELLQRTGERRLLVAHDSLVHDLILRHCGNRKLVEIMEGLSDLIRWARNVITADLSMYEAAIPEHLTILAALRAGDVIAAEAAMRTHLVNSFDRTRIGWHKV